MKSVHRSRDRDGNVTKTYTSGIVGFQPSGMTHGEYATGMKPLKKATAANNSLLSPLVNRRRGA